MQFFFKILFLVMLTTTYGFTAERLAVDMFKPGFRVTLRTVERNALRVTEHVQPLKLEIKQKAAVNCSFYSSTGTFNRRAISIGYTRPYIPNIQKRFYTTHAKDKDTEPLVENHSQTFAIPTKDVKNLATTEARMAYEKIKSSNLPREVTAENLQQDAEFFERYSQHIGYLKQQAEAKAKIERNIEIAKNMLNENMDKDMIAKITGLLPEEISKLSSE